MNSKRASISLVLLLSCVPMAQAADIFVHTVETISAGEEGRIVILVSEDASCVFTSTMASEERPPSGLLESIADKFERSAGAPPFKSWSLAVAQRSCKSQNGRIASQEISGRIQIGDIALPIKAGTYMKFTESEQVGSRGLQQ